MKFIEVTPIASMDRKVLLNSSQIKVIWANASGQVSIRMAEDMNRTNDFQVFETYEELKEMLK